MCRRDRPFTSPLPRDYNRTESGTLRAPATDFEQNYFLYNEVTGKMAEIATENKAPSSGKKLKVWLIVLAAVLIVGGVVLFLKIKSDRDEALRQSIIGSGTFHPGITVAGVDVSGLSLIHI